MGAPTGDYLRRDSIGHCAGHKVSFWSVAIESRHSFLQNDTLKGVRRNMAGAQWAPLRRWRVTFASVASLRDPSLTLEDDATGHGECAPTEVGLKTKRTHAVRICGAWSSL